MNLALITILLLERGLIIVNLVIKVVGIVIVTVTGVVIVAIDLQFLLFLSLSLDLEFFISQHRFHPRWRQKGTIMTFVSNSKSQSKGYGVRIYQFHVLKTEHSKAISRLENKVSPSTLLYVEFNFM